MKQIFTLAIALLIALAPLGVAAEPLPTDTTGASPPAPEVTYLEPSESQSTNITPLLCVNESSTSGPLLSDIKVGCDESGEYFSESGGSVTVTDTPEPWSVNISESDYDSRDLDQSIIDTCEENGSTEQPEWLTDTVPDGTTTDATLHASVQPSRIRNITVESKHPYANNFTYTWEISDPGAHQMRLHFDKLSLAGSLSHYDTLRIYDELGRELVYYKGPTDNTDFWTEWQTTDTLRVKLVTDGQYTSYGFLIDLIETEEGVFTPSQIPAPANLTLHPGWNFISVPRPLAAGNDTALIFAPVETDGHSVLRYDAAAGEWVPLVATDRLAPLEGFWMYSTEPSTVLLNFSTDPLLPPAKRSLSTGWNAVGVTSTIPATARDTFHSVNAQWTTLIGFNAGKQAFEAGIVNGGSGTNADTRSVYPGKGYWLYMTEPGTLCAIGA